MRLSIVIAVCALGLAACEGPDTELDPHELNRATRNFSALSSEASLLAGQLAAQSVTSAFASVHQQALGEESLKLSKELAKPVAPGLRTVHDALTLLNARFQTEVAQIAQASPSAGALERLGKSFRDMASQAKALETPG